MTTEREALRWQISEAVTGSPYGSGMTATMHHHESLGTDQPVPVEVPILRGRPLRFILLDHLMSVGQTTVAAMVEFLADKGYDLDGRASKIISDSLRWEVRRRRIIRVARGVYRYRSAPATTARRVRLFADRCHRWLDATLLGRRPPPTPPDPRCINGVGWARPEDAPWRFMMWLWVA